MEISICKSFTFEASHQLPWHPGKCKKLHGHSYKLDIEVSNRNFLDSNGIVLDFDDLTRWVQTHVIDLFDHTHLNDIIENPTAENIALTVYNKLAFVEQHHKINSITLWETAKSKVTLRPSG